MAGIKVCAKTVLLVLLVVAAASGGVRGEMAPDVGLEAWHWRGEDVEITLRQRLPDQSRAYFEARGFTPEQAEPIARSCVFQIVFRNTAASGSPIAFDMGEWRIIAPNGLRRPPRLQADWEAQWEAGGAPKSARIAFRWSLFPAVQRFEPGDWNMGMMTTGLTPSEIFDLNIVWQHGEKRRQARLAGLRCAPDRQD